ncbi:MAG: glycosyltransferase family 4 protein [Candidatus Micrarchaeia archaeon]
MTRTGKCKILHLISSFEVGGTETSLLELLKSRAPNEEFEHHVCTLYDRGELKGEFKKVAELHTLGLDSKISLPWGVVKFRRLVFRTNPNLVASYLAADNLVASLGCIGSKMPVVCGKRDTNTGKSALARIVDTISARFSRFTISNSLEGKRELLSYGIPKEKLAYIPTGRNADAFSLEKDRITGREIYGEDAGEIVIGCVSRIAKHKGQIDLIRVMPKLLEKNKEVLLVFVGGGDGKSLLEESEKLGVKNNVKVLGRKPHSEVITLLKSFDIFAFPSYREGFSGAIVEAMMAELPIVASDIPENKDVLEDKKEGLLFPVGDLDPLCSALDKLINDKKLREKLAKNARKRAIEEYSLESVSKKYVVEWKRAVDKN